MLWLLSGPQGIYILDFFCSVFSFISVESLSLLISFLYLDLFVLGDDAFIS